MALFAKNETIVFCVNSRLHIYTLKAEEFSPLIVEIPKAVVNSKNNETKEGKNVESAHSVVCGNFSESGRFFAICDASKQLIVYLKNKQTTSWEIYRIYEIIRKSVKVIFTSDESAILLTDRSGDVYSYDMSREDFCKGTLLMGHLSMILDMNLTHDGKFLITSDRDEKIRVSCFPNAYNIHGYCLGSKEFVSSFCFINEFTIISGSGDSTLRTWNYIDGKQLCVHDCSEDVEIDAKKPKLAVKQVIKLLNGLILVVCYSLGDVLLYKVNHSFEIQFMKCINIATKPVIKAVLFNNSVIFSTLDEQNVFICFDICNDTIIVTENVILSNLLSAMMKEKETVDYFLREGELDERARDGLYKTWYNNVAAYLERKEEREKAKRLKKCSNASESEID